MGRKWLMAGLVPAAALAVWLSGAGEPEPPVQPQTVGEPLAARIRAGAEESAQALLTGDDARVVDLTYPRVVAMLGGREAMLHVIATGRRYMEEQGIEMLSYDVDTVSDVYEAGDELHAVVRTLLKMRVPAGRMIQPGFLLAVSGDGGETWRYIDGAQLNAETVLDVVPAFNKALELPTMLEPTLEPEPEQPDS